MKKKYREVKLMSNIRGVSIKNLGVPGQRGCRLEWVWFLKLVIFTQVEIGIRNAAKRNGGGKQGHSFLDSTDLYHLLYKALRI